MTSTIVGLSQVKDVPKTTFRQPMHYQHLGVEFSPTPVWISFDEIHRFDSEHNNSGRKAKHTNDELKKLSNSFADGVQLWQELPIVSKSTDPEILKHKKWKLEVGFGRTNAVASNGEKGYWFWEVKYKCIR